MHFQLRKISLCYVENKISSCRYFSKGKKLKQHFLLFVKKAFTLQPLTYLLKINFQHMNETGRMVLKISFHWGLKMPKNSWFFLPLTV